MVNAENRGVAPFYYDWPVQVRLQREGAKAETFKTAWKLTTVLPGQPKRWQQTIRLDKIPQGRYDVAVRVVNPLKNGKPFRFANQTSQADGLLTLGSMKWK